MGKDSESLITNCLDRRVVLVARRLGIRSFTPIQRVAIPKVLTGRHTLIVAPTGSGKTEAALLPIFSKIVSKGIKRVKPVAVLYITPLRALNRDMLRRISELAKSLGISVAVRHGDTPDYRRRLMIRNPPQVIITTPETLSILLVNRGVRESLRNVRWVVIDEFHEVLNSKRGAHLLADLERLRRLAGSFQRIALSASIGNVNLAAEALAPGKIVEIALVPGVRDMRIKVDVASRELKEDLICKIIDKVVSSGKSLIFTNTRDEAEMLSNTINRYVKRMGLELRIAVHHGSLSRSVRRSVEEELKRGDLDAVISTSSLELGIDIGKINAVIQVGSPKQVTKLVQRVGRSKHSVNEKAIGYLIVRDLLSEVLEAIVIARRSLSGDLEELKPIKKPLDVLAHVLTGLGLESEFSINKALEILNKSYPFQELSAEELSKVIDLLIRLGYLRLTSSGRFSTTFKGKLYYLTTTMIVDAPRYDVVDMVSSKKVGFFDEDFIANLIDESGNGECRVVLSGSVWRVVGINEKGRKVYVEPLAKVESAMIPYWRGESIPVEYKVAREVCAQRRLIAMNHVMSQIKEVADEEVLNRIKELIKEHLRRGFTLPDEHNLLIELVNNDLIIIHSCLGSKGNKALATLISSRLSKYLGRRIAFNVTPYGVIVQVGGIDNEYINVEYLIKSILTQSSLDDIIDSLRETSLYKLVVSKVLRRMGVIPRDAGADIVKTLTKKFMDEEVIRREALNEILHRYIDVEPLLNLIKNLREGRVSIRFVRCSTPSPLGIDMYYSIGGVIAYSSRINVLPINVIANIIKRRINSKNVWLICMLCRHCWRSSIKNLPERLSCPKCGSGLIAPYYREDVKEILDIVEKGMKLGRKYKFSLNPDERKVFEEMLDSAKLVLDYGRKAIEALSMRGVGPKNAMKVLGKYDGDRFYFELYNLERTYVRTRRFWS